MLRRFADEIALQQQDESVGALVSVEHEPGDEGWRSPEIDVESAMTDAFVFRSARASRRSISGLVAAVMWVTWLAS